MFEKYNRSLSVLSQLQSSNIVSIEAAKVEHSVVFGDLGHVSDRLSSDVMQTSDDFAGLVEFQNDGMGLFEEVEDGFPEGGGDDVDEELTDTGKRAETVQDGRVGRSAGGWKNGGISGETETDKILVKRAKIDWKLFFFSSKFL